MSAAENHNLLELLFEVFKADNADALREYLQKEQDVNRVDERGNFLQEKEDFPKIISQVVRFQTKRKPRPCGGGKRESSYAITQQPCSAAWPGEPSCDWRRSCG